MSPAATAAVVIRSVAYPIPHSPSSIRSGSGQERPEVYVIATNTTSGNVTPRIVTRSALEAAAKSLPVADGSDLRQRDLGRSVAGIADEYPVRGKPWVTEFNSNPPPLRLGGAQDLRQQQTQPAVTVGERYTFRLYEESARVIKRPGYSAECGYGWHRQAGRMGSG